MNREIRFKAKRLDNGQWVEGDLLHRVTDTCIAVKDMDDILYCPVDPSTVCQYTGMKDNDGKKIWEHDLIKYKNTKNVLEVIWNAELSIFTLRYLICNEALTVPLGHMQHVVGFIVVGNKFDKEV